MPCHLVIAAPEPVMGRNRQQHVPAGPGGTGNDTEGSVSIRDCMLTFGHLLKYRLMELEGSRRLWGVCLGLWVIEWRLVAFWWTSAMVALWEQSRHS